MDFGGRAARAKALQVLEEAARVARPHIRGCHRATFGAASDEDLAAPIGGERIMEEASRSAIVWPTVDHTVHHRGSPHGVCTAPGRGAGDDLRLTEGGRLGPAGPTLEACAPPVRRPRRPLVPGLQETGAASPPLGKESCRCMPYATSVDTMGVAPPAGPTFRGRDQAGIIATPGGMERRHLAEPVHRAEDGRERRR